MPKSTIRGQIALEPELFNEVTEFQHISRINSFSGAVRQLLRVGLDADIRGFKSNPPPVVKCEPTPDGDQWRFLCKHCGQYHYHQAEPGYRVSYACDSWPRGYITELRKPDAI